MFRVADSGAAFASSSRPSSSIPPDEPPVVSPSVDEVPRSPYLGSPAKRAVDLLFALSILVVFAPLLVETALLIKATSKGPVFFRQPRNGTRKQPFEVLKFRSMRVDDVAAAPFAQARRHDPRVTLLGRFIRRSSIDELPQLFNVLKGDMSLVGPRPHPLPLDDAYAAYIPEYSARFLARPGLTGLAQVQGARGETPSVHHMQRRVSLDLHYVGNASLAMDLVILLRSAREMVASKDAY
jgi:putative colanic acid biosysnthesis UDP-glucose lipid carrier transferase